MSSIPAYLIPTLSAAGDKLLLRAPFKFKDACKSIEGRSWNGELKCWEYPVKEEIFQKIVQLIPGVKVDKAVTAMITELALAEASVKDATWNGMEPIELVPLKTNPFAHQVAAYNMAITRNATALLMEQGCGKTATAIAVAGRRYQRGEIDRVLIIAPASVVPVWPKEFDTHAAFFYSVRTLEGSVAQRVKELSYWPADPDNLQVAVTNYEATWRMEEALAAWKPDMIICDESQRVKTPGARQSKCLHKLAKAAKYRLILTGTPVSQGPLDFYSQYKFLDSSIFGNSFWAFKARYALMGGYENRQVIGYQNLPELVAKAHKVAFRCRKADCLDLPEQIDQVMYCSLEPDARRVYNQLVKESVAELNAETTILAPNVLSRLLRLSQLSGGFYKEGEHTTLVSTAKMDLLEEAVTDLLEAGKKIIIFARFLPEITAIKKFLLDAKKIGFAWISGEVPMDARGEEVRRFQEDPECRVFVAQIQTAGLGITLHAADTAIFYSLDYSFANYDQCRARIHRIGQKNACTYIHLVAKDTVDEKVLAALVGKKDLASQLLDRWREILN